MTPKEWRLSKSLSLEKLSVLTGFSRSYLSEVERGIKPGSFALAAIYKSITNGQVTANDFYPSAPTAE